MTALSADAVHTAMTLKQIVLLALQISILLTVFSFGLKATIQDLLYVVRRPGLLARSLLAVFVILPLVTILLMRGIAFPLPVQVALIALAISPLPPILPRKESKSGGNTSYGIGLMATLGLVSIAVVPLVVAMLARFFGRQLTIAPGVIAGLVMKTTLVPLLAGVAVRLAFPALAARIETPVSIVGVVLLAAAALPVVGGALPAIWAQIGSGAVIAMALMTLTGLAIGHRLGGPDPDHAVVLALSTSCRHPAIALTIASTNYPDQQFAPLIMLYLVVSGLVGIPYVRWQARGRQ
jgi:BASS family bile acid:Na+ symporter